MHDDIFVNMGLPNNWKFKNKTRNNVLKQFKSDIYREISTSDQFILIYSFLFSDLENVDRPNARPCIDSYYSSLITLLCLSLSLSLNFFFHSPFTTSEKTRINQNWRNARILIAFAWFFAILEDQLDNASQCFSPCPWNATG